MRRRDSVFFFLIVTMLALSYGTYAKGNDVGDKPGVSKAIVDVQSDIMRDTKALNALRAEIAAERRPLAMRLEDLRKTVKARRIEADRIRRLRRQGEDEQATLEAKAHAVEEECRYLLALFAEYARAMETRVGAAEATRLTERLRPLQKTLTENETFIGFADVIGRLLDVSAESNDERLGGFLFDGLALDANGIERSGDFAVLGPIAYFAADQDGPAGLAVTQFGTVQPAIYDRFAESVHDAIRDLVDGGMVQVPVDVTEGDAIKIEDAKQSLWEHVKKGGFVMYPLLAVALASVLLIIWKAIELGTVRVQPGEQLDAVMAAVRRGDVEAARAQAVSIKRPLRSLVEEAIEHRASPRDHLEEIMHEHVLTSLPWLERNLGTLAVLGGIAPLLGLLGTVTGMIHTFQLVTIFGSGDAKLLSSGISEALVTTETGLAIAIPVLLVHAFLARRARSIIGALECMAVAIVNELKVRSNST
jgi:biopolymer transport protein ExbB